MNFVFDLETSGLVSYKAPHTDLEAYNTARIVSISWILTQGDKITEQSYFIVQANDFDISPGAEAVHKISKQQTLDEGVPISTVFKELAESLTHVHSIISYNIEFDINVLKSELFRHNQLDLLAEVDKKHHICCMKKAKEYLGTDKYPKLQDTYQKIFNEPLADAHNAMADTVNCFKCYTTMFPAEKDVFFIKNRKIQLTPEQTEVVFAPLDTNIAVLASAGSGKTTTITARIKHLIDQGVPEDAIMLTTFTRDSANDMRQKLFDICGYKPEVKVGTIDSIAKGSTQTKKTELKDVGEHARHYLNLIKARPAVIKNYKYLFVDEFQDINQLQFEIVQEFYKNGTYIFAVGDDHQNIYTFRGSSIEFILNFKTLFPSNSEMFKLTFNFRSTKEIINFANESIDHNIHQIPKKMVSGTNTQGMKPEVRYFESAIYQNQFVVQEVQRLIATGVKEDEIAVLSPLNQSLFLIEEALIKMGIRNVYLDGKSDVRTLKKSGHVCLCTIHKSKGLEWEYVFLTNMSDELVPKIKNPKNIEEDRRLFYVACTRAKQRLYINYSANALAPFVTRYVSEVSQEFYNFINFKPEYISGRSEMDAVYLDMSVTKLLENLDGDDYIAMKQMGIMPKIDMTTITKEQLYSPQQYSKFVEQEELYTDFGIFIDTFISREISNAFDLQNKDKYALQALSAITLDKTSFQIYKFYRFNFKKNLPELEQQATLEPAKVKYILQRNAKEIASNHMNVIYSIFSQIKTNSLKYNLPMAKIPVFNERFLPEKFNREMQQSLDNISKKLNYKQVLDNIWDISLCKSIITNYRRRLLFMNVSPSKHMQEYAPMFENISTHFIGLLKQIATELNAIPALHEDFMTKDGVYGELDLRIGDTIIDFKNTINEEINAPWIMQLLCYKTLCEMNHKKINTIAVFNPLKGWYCKFDVSKWDKHIELLTYLLDKREQILAPKH